MNKNKARRAKNSERRKNGVQSIRQHRICRATCQTFCPTVAANARLRGWVGVLPLPSPIFECSSGFRAALPRGRKEMFIINTSRTKKLSLRLSEKEYKRITRRAKSCGLTKSAYVRQLIVGYEPRDSPPADYFAMTRELKEIGNNMNQLAFVANATGLIDEAAYYENVIYLRNSLRRVEKAVVEAIDTKN